MSGVGVLAAFLLAGLFEYNFGDSEILILLLFFITIPYVVHDEQAKGQQERSKGRDLQAKLSGFPAICHPQ